MTTDADATTNVEATPSKETQGVSGDLSPHSMANAILTEAMKERQRANANETTGSNAPLAKRFKSSNPGTAQVNDNESTNKKLDATWKNVDDKIVEFDDAYDATKKLVSGQIEGLIRAGLDAFHQLENVSRELQLSKEDLEAKILELDRLSSAEEKNRETITNLLRAVEVSKADARDTSRVALAEARLRAELSVMLSKRDEACENAEQSKRRATLLDEELRQVKTKLARVTQEKIKMERDQRATMSLAKSMDSHVSSDVDFYKRKVSELTSHVQGLNAVIAEKNRHIDEMRRQIERSMGQNRLANLRGDSGKGRQR